LKIGHDENSLVSLALFLSQCLKLACMAMTLNITTDESALLALKSQLKLVPSHVLSKNWSHSTSVCSWIGVSCSSRHQRVAALDISSMGLVGNLPSEMGNLAFLVSLNLSSNSFHGNLPQELSYLRRLKDVDLSFNNFTEIGNLYNLKMLSFQFNKLDGLIPISIFNMSNLESLALTGNILSGDLPADFCGGIPRIKELYLSSNEFNGQIPSTISKCSQLRLLSLSYNKFSGFVPRGIGNLTSLEILYLGSNALTGEIPEELGNLRNLKELGMGDNFLIGSIPSAIFNISSLQYINIANCNLTGALPRDMCSRTSQLESVYFHVNELVGELPEKLGECEALQIVSLSYNNMTGVIPRGVGNLTMLEMFYVGYNNLIEISSLITALTNCRHLTKLGLGSNLFNGTLPVSVGNLSTSLEYFYAYECRIHGAIPHEFGNLINLIILSLFGNQLTGSIPNTLVNLRNLQGLALSRNRISGTIPYTLCGLRSLNGILLHQNQITGVIPECIGNLTALREVNMGNNKLNSGIPTSLWQLNDLLKLNLSSNFLTGPLPPDIGNLKAATLLDLSTNRLSGTIPTSVEDLHNMINLSLAHNSFRGAIPELIGKMMNLEELDLSHNNLSGNIPISLEGLLYLTYFDVSFNDLSGQIPSKGPFKNFAGQFFINNGGLCGDPRYGVPQCHNRRSKIRKTILRVVYVLLGFAGLVFFLTLAYVFITYRRKEVVETQENLSSGAAPLRASYYDLLQATGRFNESHLLGAGGFSSVYKGTLQNGEEVAIKVFNSQVEKAFESFDTECEVLRSLRHRNLCKVVSACSNEDFKALVLEYMPNGSLDKWLHSDGYFLDFVRRIGVMIDVACALEYLHYGCSTTVVHCDLKPSNVLLDGDMVGRLSDFGIAKLLGHDNSFVQTNTFATLGYIAPEYGSQGIVSIRCDVYSFGILLMEVFTGMKPSGERFAGDLSLRSWVEECVPDSINRIIDPKLVKLDDEEEYANGTLECLSSIMELALKCSMESPLAWKML
ncbi:hypothetical protein MIMGU_mgv1a025198mg, partial [Erythranthe guttata]